MTATASPSDASRHRGPVGRWAAGAERGHGAPALPGARGPLSATVLDVLAGRGGRRQRPWDPAGADPFGEDLQLALYVCYELHYRGFAGVAETLEWDPEVLRRRAELEAAFLAALRAQVPYDAGGDPWPAVDALLGATGDGGASAFLAAEGERWHLRELAVHRSLYHLKEADPQAWVIPRLEGRAKAALVAVEFDEYGSGAGERMHSRLFADLMAELGLVTRYGWYTDAVPAPMLAVVNFMSLCGLHRALRGSLVGQFAAVEITSPPGSHRMLAALRRLGLGPEAQRFYAEHAVADSVHEQVMRHDVLGDLLDREPQLAPDVAFGIAAGGWLDDRLDAHLLACWRDGRTSLRRALRPEERLPDLT